MALTQFAGMAQGDTRTQTIRLQNRSEHQANFYITEATINALQTQNLTSGGVYPFRLQVGKNLTTADSLLFASPDTNKKKSSKLKHFEYVTTLDAGNDTYLFLTFKLVMEENTSQTEDNYKDGVFGVLLLGGVGLVASAVIAKNHKRNK